MSLKIGGLFAGYGGLELGVSSVLDAEPAWFSEIDKGALKVLTHRFPDVPNVGNITETDWSSVEPVDILTGGFPCQDLSHAGARAGMRPGTRSGLWSHMAYAINELRPRLVVAENVRGLLSGRTERSEEVVTFGPKGGRKVGYTNRALGRVLSDLAELGYDAQWHGLRAADVGAPHGRFRVFVIAYPHSEGRIGQRWLKPGGRDADRRCSENGSGATTQPATLLPTPVADNSRGLPSSGTDFQSLPNAVCALLPTPEAAGASGGRKAADFGGTRPSGAKRAVTLATAVDLRWGQYADAIARWEHLTREAPAPTELGAKGNPRLAAAFSEWMMGLPAGWVTDVPGITRNEALKAVGNGVCPQQAAAALRLMLGGAA